MMSLIAIALGAFGSVFNTYSGLYMSKDNDLLLSLPIPVRSILASRLASVYLLGLMYSAVVIVPAVIVYWVVVPVTFAAVIGTPVPAVIGTDYRARERMLAKKTELPVLTVITDGMELYDKGEEKAYLALFEKFSDKNEESEDMNDKDRPHIGIIGMTPQDVSDLKAADKIRKVYADQGMRAICYGMGDRLDEVRNASLAAKNVVVSPAALKAAQYLQKKFGTPYEIAYPLVSELVPEVNYQGKKILIVQQQVIANAVRKEIEKRTGEKETTATWFMRKEEILTDLNVDAVDDISLKEEDDFISLVEKEGYDVIFADPCMERMIPGFEGVFIPLTHFAVSGKLNV